MKLVPLTVEHNQNENVDNIPDNSTNPDVDANDDNDDDADDDDNEDDEENASYTISTGNEGFVLVNQMTDYINRGDALKLMCLWEYCSKVYKKKYTGQELEKHKKKAENKKSNRECEQIHLFSTTHPQSKTHWQKVRIKGSAMVPTLSKLPPTSNQNKIKYQKCVLLLFKPFTCFEELYDGISWDETYSNFLQATNYRQYVENLQELHIGIEEKQNDESNEVVDEIEDEECDDDPLNETDVGLDSQTTEALDIIRNTSWLDESISTHQTEQNI